MTMGGVSRVAPALAARLGPRARLVLALASLLVLLAVRPAQADHALTFRIDVADTVRADRGVPLSITIDSTCTTPTVGTALPATWAALYDRCSDVSPVLWWRTGARLVRLELRSRAAGSTWRTQIPARWVRDDRPLRVWVEATQRICGTSAGIGFCGPGINATSCHMTRDRSERIDLTVR